MGKDAGCLFELSPWSLVLSPKTDRQTHTHIHTHTPGLTSQPLLFLGQSFVAFLRSCCSQPPGPFSPVLHPPSPSNFIYRLARPPPRTCRACLYHSYPFLWIILARGPCKHSRQESDKSGSLSQPSEQLRPAFPSPSQIAPSTVLGTPMGAWQVAPLGPGLLGPSV